MNDPLKRTYCFANGEYNTEGEIEATKDGIEIDLGIYISWDWIDSARHELTKHRIKNNFHCPKCGGEHFIVSKTGELICCYQVASGLGVSGCGWIGVLNEPPFPKSNETVIPSEHPHGPTDRSDMYYTEGYQKWVEARNRAME